MTIDREEASALLHDVEGMEARVRQILIYAHISEFFFLWGAIFAGGFTATYFLREKADAMWWGLEALGLAATVGIAFVHHRRADAPRRAIPWRVALTTVTVIGFGTLWVNILHMGWREQVTFWPTFLSFLVFLVGLWLGRTLALSALAIFAISLAGYFVAGPYLHLWMAAALGGSLFAAGLWLRR
jgi:membrane-associated HD superfamily phosphohydrolase